MLTTNQKLFLARLAQKAVMAGRGLFGRPPITTVRRGGLRWVLDLREGIDFSIWLFGAFEVATVRAYRRLLRPGQTVLDIGANIGAHTLHFAHAVGPSGKVYAFEPTDYAFAKLNANAGGNPELLPRIAASQVMLAEADSDAVKPLYSSWPLDGKADVNAMHGGQLMSADKARATSLDAFLDAAGVNRVDFVKIDVDGFECGVLRGAQRMLTRMRPLIVMELSPHQLDEMGSSIEDLVGLLQTAGYALEDLASGKPLPMSGSGLRAMIPYGGSRNAIARAAASHGG